MQPSRPIRIIRRLPVGKQLALKLYNRFLMHFAPVHLVRTYFGAEIECNARDMIQSTIIHFRAWEPNTSAILSRLVKPGDVVVDVGANIGYYSLLFSKLVGPKGKVVAIEALPKLAQILSRNLERNSATNVRVVNAAAGEPGSVVLYEAPRSNIGMTTTRADRGFPEAATVQALPLEWILSNDEAAHTRLIKIDIEGGEVPVVERLLDTLALYSPELAVAVEANPIENPEWTELFERFRAEAFKAYDLGNDYDWMRMMAGVDAKATAIDALPAHQVDLLFTRKEL
jgi:FkbM family methyltransferase